MTFVVTSFSSGAVDEAAPTNESKPHKYLTDFQVKMNITVTLFGKRISGKLLYEI